MNIKLFLPSIFSQKQESSLDYYVVHKKVRTRDTEHNQKLRMYNVY